MRGFWHREERRGGRRLGARSPCHAARPSKLSHPLDMLAGMSLQTATARVPVQRALDEAMARNHGLLTRKEAIALGATEPMISGLLRRGIWIRVHNGVYRHVAAPRTPVQELKAAELAGGDGARASHRSATWTWSLLATSPDRPEISIPHGRRARLENVTVHRPVDLVGRPPVLRQGLWVTDPMRTVLDVAAVLPQHVTDLVVDRAIGKKLVTATG